MKMVFLPWGSSRGILPALIVIVVIAASAEADQVDMQNGDRFSGKVVALESNTVVLNSDVLGTVRLRRDQIASMSFGAKATPNTSPTAVPKAPPVPVVSPLAGPNPQIDLNSSLGRHITANSNLVSDIQRQVLTGAGPKAVNKYDAIIGGLSTGNLNIADVRKEAAAVAAQLRQLGSSGDDESAGLYNEYLAILDSFLAETKSAVAPAKPFNPAKPAVVGRSKPSSSAAAQRSPASPKPEDE